MSIITELSRIQKALKAPKTLYNKFGGYYYRNAESILEAVKPLLGDLALIINDEPVVIGGRFYIKATTTLTDGENSISTVAYAREDETKKGMDGCQITGACSSYARKYALNALLMIDDNKDSDDNSLSPKNLDAGKEQTEQKPAPKPATPKPQAQVNTGGALPQTKAPEKPQPAPNETTKPMSEGAAYLTQEKKKLEQELGADFSFGKARMKLVADGVVENIPSAIITLDQAKELIKAMRDAYGKKVS